MSLKGLMSYVEKLHIQIGFLYTFRDVHGKDHHGGLICLPPPTFEHGLSQGRLRGPKIRHEGALWTRSTKNLCPGLVGLRSQVEAGSARVIGVQKFSSFLKGGV